MIGAIVGDIVGSIYEFNNHRSKDFPLFGEGCFATDDSIMTIAIGQAIVDCAKGKYLSIPEAAIRNMVEIGRYYPGCGFGGHFYSWIFGEDHSPYNSYGNGAAMRVSAVVGLNVTRNVIVKVAGDVTKISHNHPEGMRGASATAELAFLAKEGHGKDELLKVAKRYYDRDFMGEFRCDNIRKTYMFNETCQETVPQAIEAFLEADDFEDAIRNAISIGGDSDTLAAITGTIAEWYFGVPENIANKAASYLDDRLWKSFDAYHKMFHGNKVIADK